MLLATYTVCALLGEQQCRAAGLHETIAAARTKVVKIYGAGGFRGLEPYQSGVLISADGHVLTAWSHVLDTKYLRVTLDDGRRNDAKLLGADPRLEIAVLKIEADDLDFFDLAKATKVEAGTPVLAISNLFGIATGDEPASVQRGVISAKTSLAGRRGAFASPYRGQVYVLDAVTNNPGASGGALVDRHGNLLAMLGKELRNARNNTWLNYAVPVAEFRHAVTDIIAGKARANDTTEAVKADDPWTLADIGIALVPNVVERTPPYVDQVRPKTPAATVGLRPDDLIIFVAGEFLQSQNDLADALRSHERELPLSVTVLRDQQLVDVELLPPSP
ncbi:MAG: S1C family serine protease [Pirellulales bacterium]|nr:S1C family serine protease [Pirellulales bacterium]